MSRPVFPRRGPSDGVPTVEYQWQLRLVRPRPWRRRWKAIARLTARIDGVVLTSLHGAASVRLTAHGNTIDEALVGIESACDRWTSQRKIAAEDPNVWPQWPHSTFVKVPHDHPGAHRHLLTPADVDRHVHSQSAGRPTNVFDLAPHRRRREHHRG